MNLLGIKKKQLPVEKKIKKTPASGFDADCG